MAISASTNVIMMSAMFIMAGALNKTSLVNKVRDFIMSREYQRQDHSVPVSDWSHTPYSAGQPSGRYKHDAALSMALGKDSPVSTSQLLYPEQSCHMLLQALTPSWYGTYLLCNCKCTWRQMALQHIQWACLISA